jgi:peptidoglycan/xylan/chitin deacetylase (PgdA/CDA1 family)
MYHRIAPMAGDPQQELVPAQRLALFEDQLDFLRGRYRLVRASELRAAAAERRRGERIPVAVTFDDDSPTHATYAAPALERLGVPATFFLNGASLDRPFAFWWERLQRAWDSGAPGLADLTRLDRDSRPTIHALGRAIEAMRPSARDEVSERLLELAGPDPPDSGLRRQQVAELSAAGFEIGFHTRRHDRLPDLKGDELAEALVDGRAELAEAAGADMRVIAYPHGRADARVGAAARAAGFGIGFTDLPRVITFREDPLLLGRLLPSPTSVDRLASQLARVLVRGLKRGGVPSAA